MAAPLNTCTTIEQRGVVRFLWAKDMAAKDIHKEMLPMYGEHCWSFKQSSKTSSFWGTLSWRWRGWKSGVRVVPTATTRILRCRSPGTCETEGQVFKFVWRLRWKINYVCMSLSPFVSFQSLFVTYLLTLPRGFFYQYVTKYHLYPVWNDKILYYLTQATTFHFINGGGL